MPRTFVVTIASTLGLAPRLVRVSAYAALRFPGYSFSDGRQSHTR